MAAILKRGPGELQGWIDDLRIRLQDPLVHERLLPLAATVVDRPPALLIELFERGDPPRDDADVLALFAIARAGVQLSHAVVSRWHRRGSRTSAGRSRGVPAGLRAGRHRGGAPLPVPGHRARRPAFLARTESRQGRPAGRHDRRALLPRLPAGRRRRGPLGTRGRDPGPGRGDRCLGPVPGPLRYESLDGDEVRLQAAIHPLQRCAIDGRPLFEPTWLLFGDGKVADLRPDPGTVTDHARWVADVLGLLDGLSWLGQEPQAG